jgi:hypothetical protein
MRTLVPLLVLLSACPEPGDSAAAKPDDTGVEADTALDTGETAAENVAPSAPAVSISPAQPNTASVLKAVVDVEAVDPEGGAVEYSYAWLQNGAVVSTLTGASVPADQTTDGDTWELQVAATDGLVWSDSVSAVVTLANVPPVAPVIRLDPEAPIGGDTLTLVFDVSADDANGDLLTQTITWYFDGVHSPSFDNRASVDGVYVDGGETFRAVVSVTDGLSDPVEVEASVTVFNTAPSITSVTISPTDPLDADDLECAARATDEDGSDPTLFYQWYRDGVVAADVGDDTTVLAELTTVGEQWECEVQASDGFDSATALSSPVTIREPSGYRVTATVEVTVSTDSAGDDVAIGSAEWEVISGGGSYETNDCSIYWSLAGVEDATVCRGCIYSFAAEYTYDASQSSVAAGCAALPADSVGGVSFENRRVLAMTATLDDVYYSLSSYYGGRDLRFYESGSGGYSYSYGGRSSGSSYEVLETADAYGRTVLTGYSMRYLYY